MTNASSSEDPVTIEEMAAIAFEPWRHDADDWKPPSNDQWTALANPHLISVRLAWLTVHKTKDELIAMAAELGDDGIGELVAQIERSADWFKGLHELLSGAECRIMCAYAAGTSADADDASEFSR